MIIHEHIPVVAVPASKSVSNRLLMLQHTAFPSLRLTGLSESADTRLLQSLLERITCSSRKSGLVELDVQNCGAAFRFLLPFLAGREGVWRIVGDERLRQRPILPLVELLRGWGADIRMPEEGSVPLEISGNPDLQPQSAFVDIGGSSQFLSALLLSLPAFGKEVSFRYAPDAASASYLRMTVGLMQALGLQVTATEGEVRYAPGPNPELQEEFHVEGDWSAAAYWWAWAALQPHSFSLLVKNLTYSPWQGDTCIRRILAPWGVRSVLTADGALVIKCAPPLLPDTFRLDARNCLDLVPLLVVLCLLSGIPSRFDGVDNLRLKESDRVEALRENLSPWADVTFSGGCLSVVPTGTPVCGPVSFRSFMDHRIVMVLNLFSAFVPVSFDNPEVVSKSYPAFWEQVGALVRKA